MVIIFFGKPGSGKDTQAELFALKYKINIINIGKIIRDDKAILSKEQKLKVQNGILLEDETIEKIFLQNFNASKEESIILDGFPRTLHQTKMLLGLNLNLLVFNLEISDAESRKRLLKRKKIEGRLDDDHEIINQRLNEFKNKTQPIINLLIDNNLLVNINGERTINDISNEIETIYRSKIK